MHPFEETLQGAYALAKETGKDVATVLVPLEREAAVLASIDDYFGSLAMVRLPFIDKACEPVALEREMPTTAKYRGCTVHFIAAKVPQLLTF